MALTWVFILSGAASAAGFVKAKAMTLSNGPTKRIADFSAFMAYAFGTYLFACLALAASWARAGSACALVYAGSFCVPFVVAGLFRDYEQAEAAFRAQTAALLAGVAWAACHLR